MNFNYKRLKGRIREYYGSQENAAKNLNLSTTALNNKLNGKTQFTSDELFILINEMEVTPDEIKDIFFKVNVGK